MKRDDELGRERAAEELQRQIDREVSGEPAPPGPPPSLRDLFRERMLHPPAELEDGERDTGEAHSEE